jgi:hypothetical protein
LLLLVVWAAAVPAEAQQIRIPMPTPYDKVRIAGFFWRGKPSGTLRLRGLANVPGFEDGISISDTLGFDKPETGWIVEGNFAAGRRHRFIFEFSRLDASAEQSVDVPGFGPLPSFLLATRSDINLREFHGFYNFLFVARPQVEFGVLGGVGWFETEATILSNIGSAAATLDQAFPSFGANILLNPKGPVRGYVELSGFPRVTIDDLSGWQFDFLARAEVFVVRSFGLIVGYRRYRLVFDEEVENVGLDMTWDGFIFGGQVRF